MFLDEHINRNFDKLNDNGLHIAHFINTHMDECKNTRTQDLTQFTHASNATIHRFTRKLGLDGYSDFKSYLRFESNKTHRLPSNSIDSFKQETNSTFNYLEHVDYQLLTKKMYTTSTIYLYDTGRAQLNAASKTQRISLTLHNHVIVPHDEHELKMILNKSEPDDLFFTTSLSGETHELLEVTSLLQLRQKYFISIITMKDDTLAQKANYNVRVSSNTFYLTDSTDYSSFVSYYIFFETLVREYNEYLLHNDIPNQKRGSYDLMALSLS